MFLNFKEVIYVYYTYKVLFVNLKNKKTNDEYFIFNTQMNYRITIYATVIRYFFIVRLLAK